MSSLLNKINMKKTLAKPPKPKNSCSDFIIYLYKVLTEEVCRCSFNYESVEKNEN